MAGVARAHVCTRAGTSTNVCAHVCASTHMFMGVAACVQQWGKAAMAAEIRGFQTDK